MELAGPLKIICFIVMGWINSSGMGQITTSIIPFNTVEECETYGKLLKNVKQNVVKYECVIVHHDGSIDNESQNFN